MRLVALLPVIALFGLACDTASTAKVTGAIGVDCTLPQIVVSPATVALVVGDSTQLSAKTPQPPCGPTAASVFWQSSNSAVATVDSVSGKVRAVAVGQATILVLLTSDTNVKGAAAITVNSR